MAPYRLLRRTDPLIAPTGTGIDGSGTTISIVGISDSTLAYDHSLSSATGSDTSSTSTTPPLIASTSTSRFESSTDVGVPTTVAASSTTKPIALSAVIGACVGAFIFVTAVIIFSFWVYKRYSRSLDKSTKSRGHLHRRNVHAGEQQRRSHTGIWNRLEDHNDDKWEESYHTREARDSVPADVTPMERLTMFKKSASIRTAYTHKSTDASNFSFPASYAEFDPSLATSLKASTSGPQLLLKNTDSGLISFAESNASQSVSVPRKMPIPTPPPTTSHPHRWEAAEVVHYAEGQSAEVVNPFEEDENEGGNTIHNPFFSAKDYAPSRRRRSNSTSTARSNSRSRSRANSTATQATVTPSRIKERVLNSNDIVIPLGDINTTAELPRPPFMGHAASTSTSSMEDADKERALRSLVAALEISEDEVRDRLRIASLQPSTISATSSISVEMDMTNEFPLPPSTPTTSLATLNGVSMSGR